jgi:ribose transport system ATP-binding protein
LIQVLAGIVPGDPGGEIEAGGQTVASDGVTPRWARGAGLSFVHQDLGLFDSLSVAENLCADRSYPTSAGRIRWGALRRAAQQDLDRFGVRVRAEAPLGSLRPVERTLVAIVRALRGRADEDIGVLVLDEPTARLPDAEVERLLGSLRELVAQGQTILYVSHRLDEVLGIASSVTVLRDGQHVVTRDCDGLGEAELAALIAGRRLAAEGVRASAAVEGPPMLEVRELAGGPLRGVSFALGQREVLGVAGLVGSGRTSLLESVFGVWPRTGGEVLVDGRPLHGGDIGAAIAAGMAYVPEDRVAEGSFLDMGIPENLSAPHTRRYRTRLGFRHGAERRDAARIVAEYGVRAPRLTAPLHALSGGNQQKVAVARWMRPEPRILILDEPTQGVDVGARADIHRHIGDAVRGGCSVLLVSSDLDELTLLADRVVVLAAGRITRELARPGLDRHTLAEAIYA